MSQLAINQVLAQIRAVHAQASPAAKPAQAPGATQGPGFAELLKRGIEEVNRSQQSANGLVESFERGAPGVELGQVMVEMQKANVSFRALTEVRNRFVAAYQEIMNMPI